MFKFRSNEEGSAFECKLDKERFKPCSSPKEVKHLAEAKHRSRSEQRTGLETSTPRPQWTDSRSRLRSEVETLSGHFLHGRDRDLSLAEPFVGGAIRITVDWQDKG